MGKAWKVKFEIKLSGNKNLIPSAAESLCDIERTTEYFFLLASQV